MNIPEQSNKDLLDSFVKSLYCPSCEWLYGPNRAFHKTISWSLKEIFVFKPPYRHYVCSQCNLMWYLQEDIFYLAAENHDRFTHGSNNE